MFASIQRWDKKWSVYAPGPVPFEMSDYGGGVDTFYTVVVRFKKASAGAKYKPLEPGTCAWVGRQIRPNEPATFMIGPLTHYPVKSIKISQGKTEIQRIYKDEPIRGRASNTDNRHAAEAGRIIEKIKNGETFRIMAYNDYYNRRRVLFFTGFASGTRVTAKPVGQ